MVAEMAEASYYLRQTLIGHEEDVRSVTIDNDRIVTGSRDKTVRIWSVADQSKTFELETLLIGHLDFVTSVCSYQAGALLANSAPGIVSGSRDLSVIVWDVKKGVPAQRLVGHKYQVSCVAVGSKNEVISTSHDGTVRVYSGPGLAAVATLEGHDGPVQAVLALPDGAFLTGAADGKIKRWAGGQCRATFAGHTDTVRGLALLPGIGVVSASHDMTLRLWDFGGHVLSELLGHTALVYAAAASEAGLIASASEDRTARVWRADGTCLAVLRHPGCVWDVAFLPGGDLVTGCSDFAARVWTADEARSAPAEVQAAHQASLAQAQPEASSSKASELPDGLKLEDAATLLQPGAKDGQIKVVSEDGGGMAYSWNSAGGAWERVGQVVSGPSGGDLEAAPSSVDGTEYDHVISVEVDGFPQPLRLGVNRGDNPYTLADNFIARHGLPESYREQIVQYVVQNTGASVGPGSAGLSVNADPFTGSGAYIPGQSAAPQPGRRPPASSVTGGGVDPFTGASSGQASAGRHIPATTMLVFDTLGNPAAIAAKVRALSAKLAEAPDYGSLLLDEPEGAPGGGLDRLLASVTPAATGAKGPGEGDLVLLRKLLRWPAFAIFPTLDIARMALLHESTAEALAADAGPLELSPLGTLGAALATACAEPQLPANQQTGLRLLCNLFRSPAARTWLRDSLAALLDGFSPALSAPSKPARAAGAAFLLNVAIMLRSEPLGDDAQAQTLSAINGLLAAAPPDDEETLYRGVVALGTLLSGASRKQGQQVAAALDCGSALAELQRNAAARIREAAAEAAALL